MFNYKATLQSMKRERASMQAEIDRLDQAIAALQALAGGGADSRTKPGRSAQAKKVHKTKRKISAEGLRNIIRAQNKRWAKVRATAKKKGKAASSKKASEPSPATKK
jgi:hypothetical protein